VYTRCFSTFDNARQLACYAGVAPFEYTSGTSIRGKTRVSPMANKKLKVLLSMCALNAKKADPEIGLYYLRKTEEGKNPMSVINAIRNKLILRVFATVKRGTPCVTTMNYAA
ncbi:MAG: transposase, partial [Bacteroidia bacterium]